MILAFHFLGPITIRRDIMNMGSILPIVLLVITLFIAISVGAYAYKGSKSIFTGQETSTSKIVLNSLLFGVSSGAFMFAVFMSLWFFGQRESLTFQSVLSLCVIPILLGIFIFFVSIWRFFVVGKLRDWLFKKK
jgi:hypothetical protein